MTRQVSDGDLLRGSRDDIEGYPDITVKLPDQPSWCDVFLISGFHQVRVKVNQGSTILTFEYPSPANLELNVRIEAGIVEYNDGLPSSQDHLIIH